MVGTEVVEETPFGLEAEDNQSRPENDESIRRDHGENHPREMHIIRQEPLYEHFG